MKNKIITSSLIIIGILFLSGCLLRQEDKASEQNKMTGEKFTKDNITMGNSIEKDNVKDYFIDKYNPTVIDDWQFKFTKDVKKASEKKLLLYGQVYDLYEREGKYFMKFNPLISDSFFGTFEISKEQFEYIDNNVNREEYFNEMIAVVEINNVSKPIFKIDGSINIDFVQIDASPSDSFLLEGKLIDIKKIK